MREQEKGTAAAREQKCNRSLVRSSGCNFLAPGSRSCCCCSDDREVRTPAPTTSSEETKDAYGCGQDREEKMLFWMPLFASAFSLLQEPAESRVAAESMLLAVRRVGCCWLPAAAATGNKRFEQRIQVFATFSQRVRPVLRSPNEFPIPAARCPALAPLTSMTSVVRLRA